MNGAPGGSTPLSRPVDGRLPSFASPPVVEVAVVVEFLQLPGLGAVELVKLHELWRDRFPKLREQSALPPSPPVGASASFQFQFTLGIRRCACGCSMRRRRAASSSERPTDTKLASKCRRRPQLPALRLLTWHLPGRLRRFPCSDHGVGCRHISPAHSRCDLRE